MKRCLILMVTFLFCCISFAAFALEETPETVEEILPPYTYAYTLLDDGTVSLDGLEGEVPEKLTVPGEVEGLAVTKTAIYAQLVVDI
ncbi:MAG: hypothetical protein IIX10_06215, partial [Clostridia bacterium]|nr:hypothetical protein [Clostridia bacterium]